MRRQMTDLIGEDANIPGMKGYKYLEVRDAQDNNDGLVWVIGKIQSNDLISTYTLCPHTHTMSPSGVMDTASPGYDEYAERYNKLGDKK